MSKPKISGGVTQNDRVPRGLQPGHFRLDDRTIQDLLVEAHEYARLLRYYGPDYRPDGDWTCFWKSDPIILLATIAALNTDEIRRKYEAIDLEFGLMLRRFHDPDDDTCAEDPTDDYYRQLLRYLRDMAQQLEQHYRDLHAAGLPLAADLLRMIKRDNACDDDELTGVLQRLIGLHKLGDDYLTFEGYKFAFKTDAPPSHDNHWDLADRVIFEQILVAPTLDRVLLREVFIIFYKSLVLLKNRAQRNFDLSFHADQQSHPPHVALFLTFLRLFRHAQSSLNDLVSRHLDFYYEQVLGLRRRPESPDEAYLVLELAKGIDAYLVEKGAELIGGKDKNGKPLVYEAVEDWVVRGGKVMDLKNTYVDPVSGRMTANPDVHKKYLGGVELPNEKASRWRAMGDDRELPAGEVGFAIASPQLILREGRRVVDVVMTVQGGMPAAPALTFADLQDKDYFQAFMSTEKEWLALKYDNRIKMYEKDLKKLISVDKGSFNILFGDDELGPNVIRIRIVLEKDDLPVDTLGEKLAQTANFTTAWPILKVVLKPDLNLSTDSTVYEPGMARVYETLRTLVIDEIAVTVDVRGIRENLIIQSDQGVFNGTQKVYPFGPVPEIGSNFYVGSTEAFQKALSHLEVHFDWIDAPASIDEYYTEYQYVGETIPNPFVRVDFIDRAIAPPAKQVALLGMRAVAAITGRVTNIENEGLPGVTVRLIDTTDPTKVDTVESQEDGEYTLTITDVINTATIQFKPPAPIVGNDDVEYYEDLVKASDPQNDDPTKKAVITAGTAASVNAILFPRSRQFKVFTGLMVKVMDVHGVSVSTVKIKLDNETADYAVAGGELNLPSLLLIPEEMQIIDMEDYEDISTSNTVSLRDFSEVEVVLKPKELPAIDSTSPSLTGTIKIVGGTISSTEKDDNGDPRKLQDASVKFEDVGQIIRAFSNTNGNYRLPVAGVSSVLEFYAGHHVHLIRGRTPLTVSGGLKKTVNATLFSPEQIREVFFLEEVVIDVSNYLGALQSDVIIRVKSPGATSTFSTIRFTEPIENGRYSLSDIEENTTIEFSRSDLQTLTTNVGNFPKLDITMLPKDGIERLGTKVDGSQVITIHIFDNDGQAFNPAGLKIIETSSSPENAAATVSAGIYTITVPDETATLTLTCPGFEAKLPFSVEGKPVINVFLEPTNKITVAAGEISGKIVNAQGIIQSGLSVVLEGYLPVDGSLVSGELAFIKYETTTIGTDDFTLTRLNHVTNRRMIVTDMTAGHVTELDIPVTGTMDIFHTTRIQKSPLLDSGSLTGKVTRMVRNPGADAGEYIPIAHVMITNGQPNGLLVNSDADGNFSLNTPFPDQLTFIHPLYQDLVVHVEAGCLHLEVKLIPKPVYGIVSGMVKDIFGDEIPGADVSVGGISMAKSAADGNYEPIRVPLLPGLADVTYGFENYEPVTIYAEDVGTEIKQTVVPSGFTRSALDVVLAFVRLNFVGLINDETDSIEKDISVIVNALNLKRDIRTQSFDKYSPTLKRGFIRLVLVDDDFRHKVYPQVLTKLTIHASSPDPKPFTLIKPEGKDLPAATDPPPLPNTPYTPATNGISLDYISTQKILTENGGTDQYFHLLSFNGHKQLTIPKALPVVQWIYPYPAHDKTKDAPYARGNLFIGLSELTPGGSLSLLVRVADGTEADPEQLAPVIHWSYMGKDNSWLPFGAGQILRDDTRGLTRGGIIQFTIPTTVVRENTLFDPRYYWLRAAAVEDDTLTSSARALSDIVDIQAQALQVRFKNQDNELGHLAAPVAAGSISKLAFSRTEVKKVEQPEATFGGRLPELLGLEFYTRISERLRHKDRAVLGWDYEHLLLEHYTEIATVKCLPHTRYRPAIKPIGTTTGFVTIEPSETAPGYVTVAVIPHLRKRADGPWPQPRFSKGDLDEMADYLAARANLFVATDDYLQVVNPLYEQVNVTVQVDFREKVDEAFFTERLRQELEHYLSPWLADSTAPPTFGRSLQHSAILHFIEERPYIDTVYLGVDTEDKDKNPVLRAFSVTMLQVTVSGEPVKDQDGKPIMRKITPTEEIVPSTLRSILVAGDMHVSVMPDLSDSALVHPEVLPPPPASAGIMAAHHASLAGARPAQVLPSAMPKSVGPAAKTGKKPARPKKKPG